MSKQIKNSETYLKSSFEKHVASFDQEAFDKFRAKLDEREKKKRGLFYWLKNSRNFLSILLLVIGLTSLSFGIKYFKGLNNGIIEVSGLEDVPTKTEQSSAILSHEEQNIIDQKKSSEEIVLKESKEERINTIGGNNEFEQLTRPKVFKEKALEQKFKNQGNRIEIPAITLTNLGKVNSEDEPAQTRQQTFTDDVVGNSNSKLIDPIKIGNTTINPMSLKENPVASPGEISILDIRTIDLKQLEQTPFHLSRSPIVEIKPLPYDRHFYLNISSGVSYSDYSNHFDQFIRHRQDLSVIIQLKVAYQLTRNTAIGLSFVNTKWKNSWQFKEAKSFETHKDNQRLVSLNMTNRIFSLGSKIDVSLLAGTSYLLTDLKNDNSDERTPEDLPFGVQFYETDWTPLKSGHHFYLDSGLLVDYRFSDQISANVLFNVMSGFKGLSRQNVFYIFGEGIPANYETETTGGFMSLELGLQYRFR